MEIVCVCGFIGKGKGIVIVDGELVCEIDIMFVLGDKKE